MSNAKVKTRYIRLLYKNNITSIEKLVFKYHWLLSYTPYKFMDEYDKTY